MAQFGGVDCDFAKGVPEPMREAVESWSTPGIDGHGFHRVGRRGMPYPVKLVKFGTEAQVRVWANSIRNTQAATVVYTDDHDETSPLCFVLMVGSLRKSVAIGEGGKRGEIEVTVQAVSG